MIKKLRRVRDRDIHSFLFAECKVAALRPCENFLHLSVDEEPI